MPDSLDYDERAHRWVRNFVRSEMVKREVTYAQLSKLLELVGLHLDERNLRNKVTRGTFSGAFFVQCLAAMGCKTITIDLLDQLYPENWDENALRDKLRNERLNR